MIKGLKHKEIKDSISTMKSVKSLNPWKSVIQTSYNIVKAHGGSISVISNYSEPGTMLVNTFNVRLLKINDSRFITGFPIRHHFMNGCFFIIPRFKPDP